VTRQVRRGAEQARLAAIRAAAEARAARNGSRQDIATRHHALTASYQAMETAYRERERILAGVMDDRRAWEHATAERRGLAVAADTELRRRHPHEALPPLRSAAPTLLADSQTAELNLSPDRDIPEIGQWIKDVDARRQEFARQMAERRRLAASQDPGRRNQSQFHPGWSGFGAEALLQPPKPEIRPSELVLERTRERQAGIEAAR